MTPISDKLKTIRDTLTGIEGANVSHYRRPPNLNGYIVWYETSDHSEYSDSRMHDQIVSGRIEYWTNVEYDQVIDMIQEALNENAKIGWRLYDVSYDDELGLISYEWEITVT